MLSLISWSEMWYKNFPFGPLFQLFATFHLLFFTVNLVKNLDEVCSSWEIFTSKILMMSHLRYYNYLIHPRMNCIFLFFFWQSLSSVKWSVLAHLKSQPRGQNFQAQKPVEHSSPHQTRINKNTKKHI